MERSLDRWNSLCEQLEIPDGLPTWEAGAWTQDKLYFWMRYIDITTNAMTGHTSFPGGIVYVDLFAGAGVCALKRSRRRFPGSALIAASAPKAFSKIIACEQDSGLADACRTRLSRTAVSDRCIVHQGDCNQLIDAILREIPQRSLTLAFIDPKGLDIKFETVRKLATVRADLVVLFADAYDISRNYDAYYRDNPESKLDEVLGPGVDWRARLDALNTRTAQYERRMFAEIYKEQLRNQLGYTEFADRVMTFSSGPLRHRVPLYRLIYASKSKLGLKFWHEANKEDASGQRGLFD